jgi:two-component system sensor histidine kinase KdpD
VIVRIVDRGPGIPPAQLERVFEPFYRAGTSSSGHRGSGLGLAIARGFTQASSGSLYVESLPGQGASFVFELPLRDPASTPQELAGDGSAVEGSGGQTAASGNAPAVTGAPGKRRHERTPGA